MEPLWKLTFRFIKTTTLGLLIGACSSDTGFDQLVAQSNVIPSGSIIITSNYNGTTGPGMISVWTPSGALDRVIYDYTKVGTGYASGIATLGGTSSKLLAVTDTGGGASNDFLDLFDYYYPFANPVNLFSSLSSGAATTYMRQMALVTDYVANRYYAFISESGNNRIARLSSPIGSSSVNLNFTRDYNFAANGTCTLTTPYGVAYIPSSNNLAVIASAASGRVNIFDQTGVCVGSTAMTNFPTGVAYHAKSGKILVSYQTTGAITAHNATTGAASPATAIYTSTAQLSTPKAIATDANGYIYVASDGLGLVVKLYWDGVSASATYLGTIIQSSAFTQHITSMTVVP